MHCASDEHTAQSYTLAYLVTARIMYALKTRGAGTRPKGAEQRARWCAGVCLVDFRLRTRVPTHAATRTSRRRNIALACRHLHADYFSLRFSSSGAVRANQAAGRERMCVGDEGVREQNNTGDLRPLTRPPHPHRRSCMPTPAPKCRRVQRARFPPTCGSVPNIAQRPQTCSSSRDPSHDSYQGSDHASLQASALSQIGKRTQTS
jgi:hypothetical protein